MRPKRTIALVASPLVAAAALALPATAMSQNSDTSVASAPQAPNQPPPSPTPTPKPTKTLTPEQQGNRDGRVAGRADGQDCNYKQSFAPKLKNSRYLAAYNTSYERNYDATCVEEEEEQPPAQ
ncbi:hypothetical protein ACFV7R_00485 [Streptomyces sp. NPDC059866]|uniref:hypothetical protein n=1 Tax=Streptomyces sp. NPDC059866 TaxID=3346978 RepID=UPI00364BC8E1